MRISFKMKPSEPKLIINSEVNPIAGDYSMVNFNIILSPADDTPGLGLKENFDSTPMIKTGLFRSTS